MRNKIKLDFIENIKKNFFRGIVVVIVVFTFVIIAGNSFASPIEDIEILSLSLYDTNDMDKLRIDISNYIRLVDDSLIPNSSFNMSDKLNENYDFLTDFAISFILDNSEYYDIVEMDEYVYIDQYGNEFRTNKYINIDKIYEITNSVFGVEYYYILNDYIDIEDNMIPLLELEDKDFNSEIDSILDIDKNDDYIDVVVRYMDNELEYLYRLEYIDNRLVISNLSIRE